MEYVNRLRGCGYSPSLALRVYIDFLREFTLDDLVEFIESLEKERDVDSV